MMRAHPATPNLLPRTVVRAIDAAKIIGVRAGTRSNHRFTGVWAVVVDGRVFVRSWTLKAGGWYRTLRDDPNAVIEVGGRQVRVRVVPARGARIWEVVEQAYALKYSTPGAKRFLQGFRTRRRREATVEFVRREHPANQQRQA